MTALVHSLFLSDARVRRAWRVVMVALAALASMSALASAQATLGEMRRQMTRAELEAAAKAAESALATAPDARTRERYQATVNAYRERLENGDFLPGDRILIQAWSDSVISDTFTVRGDRQLQIANLPPISLHGVLDSELEGFLTKELLKYYRRVDLTADVLVRISLIGALARQDFVTVPVDQALTDVISGAGGFSSPPDLKKANVQREGRVLIDGRGLQEAFAKGKTVGDLSLRDGDVLFIPPAQINTASRWQTLAGAVGALGGLIWALQWVF